MKTTALSFIGGGRITRIILQALANKNRTFEKVLVYDIDTEVLEKLKKQFPSVQVVTLEEAASQSMVFMALHPPAIMEMLEKIETLVSDEASVISLAPKISIGKIQSKLKCKNIARMIPNATSYINEGFNPIAFASGFDSSEKADLMGLLSNLGSVFEVKENQLEAYALVSAMLPTYFWFQWDEMLRLGSQMGLTPHESSEALVKTLEGSINLMFQSELNYTELTDLIPVKPIGEHEAEIREIYRAKLMGLFEKIRP
ncbi:pyrroline-5-carboxylate reductase family protein [Roseimarinus sediminis]|uniref:pyrroline-5-carboxylate reductase family protein n=1 Tax=Roseimarinus sediminis TaxID=1610899 RepID=UPI003D1F07B3